MARRARADRARRADRRARADHRRVGHRQGARRRRRSTRGSPRRDRPFVRVNCAAIPRDLVESEMFGHEKGAFTGATDRRIGRFELAHTGTLFLDEVGDLGAEAQAKLLRAIEAQEIERVGGGEADPRRRAHRRGDEQGPRARRRRTARSARTCYFRLNVIPIEVPPLRERPDDIPALVRALLRAAPRAHRAAAPSVDDEARCRCWRATVAGQRARAREHRGAARDPARRRRRRRARRARGAARGRGRCGAPTPLPDPTALEQLADRHAGRLRAHADRARAVGGGGNVAEAARRLKTDRPNLYRRMRRLGIPVGDE